MSRTPKAPPPGFATVYVPPPDPGKRFMMMQLDAELVDRVNAFIANGNAETQLQERIEYAIKSFLAGGPVDFPIGR